MKLTAEQEKLVHKAVAAGQTLSQIQEALGQAGAHMTYMELRLLMDDLGLTLAEKPQPKKTESAEQTVAQEPASQSGVQVTLDSVVRPGTMVSGSATFTDGTTVQWSLDELGRLGLRGAPKGYQPPPEDIAEFQTKLRQMLEARGGV